MDWGLVCFYCITWWAVKKVIRPRFYLVGKKAGIHLVAMFIIVLWGSLTKYQFKTETGLITIFAVAILIVEIAPVILKGLSTFGLNNLTIYMFRKNKKYNSLYFEGSFGIMGNLSLDSSNWLSVLFAYKIEDIVIVDEHFKNKKRYFKYFKEIYWVSTEELEKIKTKNLNTKEQYVEYQI